MEPLRLEFADYLDVKRSPSNELVNDSNYLSGASPLSHLLVDVVATKSINQYGAGLNVLQKSNVLSSARGDDALVKQPHLFRVIIMLFLLICSCPCNARECLRHSDDETDKSSRVGSLGCVGCER